MADTLRDFFLSIGFKVDEDSRKRVEQAVVKNEGRLTAATIVELERRRAAEAKMMTDRVNAVVSVGAELEAEEKAHADRLLKIQQEQVDKERKVETEAQKKTRERRETAFKAAETFVLKFAALAAKAAVAVEAAAVGVVYATEKAASSLDRMNYAAQRIGSAPKAIGAFTYAASQLGSSIEEAQGSLDKFGENLRRLPGFGGYIESLGVRTKDAKGHMRDAADIATDLGTALGKIRDADPKYGYTNAVARAANLGFDENTTRALMNPEFRAREEERKRDQAHIGYDPDSAAQGGTDLEQSMRRLQARSEDVSSKIKSNLFKDVKPILDDISDWLDKHGDQVADIADRIAKAFVRLAKAVGEQLAKADWDDIGKKIVKMTDRFTDLVNNINGKDGLISAFEALATLVAGTWLTRMLVSVGKVVTAFGPLLRILGPLGIVAAGASAESTPGAGISSDPATRAGQALGNQKLTDDWNREHGQGNGFFSDTWNYFKNKMGFGGGNGGGGPRLLKAQQAANAAAIADELRKAGMPEEGVAAVLGSAQTESSFNPRAHNGVNGGHDGIWQWDATRWAKVKDWILRQNGDPNDVRWQARGFIAEGTARPGERLYDGPRTSGGYRKMMQSKGNLGLAAEGVYDSERFGAGEEGGRYNNAGAWLKNMPKQPDAGSTVGQQVGGEPRLPPGAMYWARDSRGNRVAVDAQGRAVTGSGKPTEVAAPAKPMVPPAIHLPTLGPSPSLLYQYDQSRSRGDQTINANQTFNITGGDIKGNLSAARMAAGRGNPDWIRNIQSAEQ